MSSNKLNTPIKIVVLSNPGTANDLRAGKTLIDSSGNLVSGTMVDINEILNKTASVFDNYNIKKLGDYAFYYCTSLTSVSFPVCTTIGNWAFGYCTKLASVNFPACTTIGSSAFQNCASLTSVSFPSCITISNNAFTICASLTSVSFPACISINGSAFNACASLTSVSFPVCTSIGISAFYRCSSLTSVNFPVCTIIGTAAFYSCTSLTSLTLGASTVCTLNNTNAFTSTPMSDSTYTGSFGSIYVPASLVDAYKSATNWATYSSRITSMG